MESLTVASASIDRQLFRAMPGCCALLLPDAPRFTITSVTDEYLKTSGRKLADLVGKGLFEAFPASPDDPALQQENKFQTSLEQVVKTGKTDRIAMDRYDITKEDGSFEEHYWSIVNKPVFSENGELTYIIHSVEDVTVHVKAERREAQIKDIEKAYSLFMQAPVVLSILKGEDLVIEMANEGAQKVWNKTTEIIGEPLADAVPEVKEQGILELLHRVRNTGIPYLAKEEPVVTWIDGKKTAFYFDRVYQPIYEDDSGIASGVFTLSHDVTELVLARQQMEEANQELKFVTDTMPQLVWATEPDGYSYFFNKGWLDYTGLTFDDVKGDGWTQSLHPDDLVRAFAVWRNAVETGEKYDVEYRLKRHDGVYRWFVARGNPMRNADGAIVKWYGTSTDIEDQKRVAKALHQSHERFDLVAKATQDAIWDWNLLTDEIWWNEGFSTLFGYPKEEIEPTIISWYSRVHPDDAERVVGGIHKVIDSGGKQWTDEYRFRKKDGSYAIVFDRGYALHDAAGKPYRMLGSMQDITERKAAADALTYQKTLLETVTANTTLALFMLDNDRQCVYMNEAAEQMTGFAFSELKGKNLHYTIHHSYPDGSPYPLEQCPLLCASPQAEQIQGEEVFIHKNGAYYTVAFTASPIVLNGDAIGTVLEVRDITEEKKREQELKENELRFRQVANSLPLVIWTASPDGNLTFISDQWESEFGNPIAESLGSGWAKFVHPDDVNHAGEVWTQSLQTGKDYEVEFRVLHKSGDYRWLLVRATPIRDADGTIIQWYGSNTDIEDKKRFEDELEKRVKERTQDLEQFTFVSHHDLQEPLRKILMFTDMVKLDGYEKLPEASQKRLDKVSDAARRMSQALKDVLNYASLAKEEQWVPVNLADVLTSVSSDLELVIEEKGARIETDALPTITAVPTQMHQLFYNLLNNALKFAKANQAPLIRISCQRATAQDIAAHPHLDPRQPYYRLAVQDNGIGFHQNAAEKIFALFQRLHSKDTYAGTGIGLALCKKVVQNHQGNLWAESTPGEGATFIMLLPAEKE